MKSFGSIMLKVYAYGFAASALLMVLTSFPNHTIVGWSAYSLFVITMALAVLAGFGLMLRKPLGPQLAWRITMPSYVVIFFVYVTAFMPPESGSYVNAIWYVSLTIVATLFIMASFGLANMYAFQPFDILTGKRIRTSHKNTPTRPINQNIVLHPARDPLLIPYTKFIIMTLVSFGIYNFYWYYRLWQYEENGTETKAGLIIRTAFYPLTAFWLFKLLKMNDWFLIAIMYILIALCAYLPFPYGVFGLLSFIPLIYAQQQINGRFKQPNSGFGTYNTLEKWIVWTIGPLLVILTLLVIIGLSLPA